MSDLEDDNYARFGLTPALSVVSLGPGPSNSHHSTARNSIYLPKLTPKRSSPSPPNRHPRQHGYGGQSRDPLVSSTPLFPELREDAMEKKTNPNRCRNQNHRRDRDGDRGGKKARTRSHCGSHVSRVSRLRLLDRQLKNVSYDTSFAHAYSAPRCRSDPVGSRARLRPRPRSTLGSRRRNRNAEGWNSTGDRDRRRRRHGRHHGHHHRGHWHCHERDDLGSECGKRRHPRESTHSDAGSVMSSSSRCPSDNSVFSASSFGSSVSRPSRNKSEIESLSQSPTQSALSVVEKSVSTPSQHENDAPQKKEDGHPEPDPKKKGDRENSENTETSSLDGRVKHQARQIRILKKFVSAIVRSIDIDDRDFAELQDKFPHLVSEALDGSDELETTISELSEIRRAEMQRLLMIRKKRNSDRQRRR